MQSIRPLVFWPPFLLIIAAITFCAIDSAKFLQLTTDANNWILETFGTLIRYGVFATLLTCIAIYVSPLGKVKIGGQDAKPILSQWRWFSISLCTTIAIGILFWGTAEPLYHMHLPPVTLGIKPNSPEAVTFAMSTMFLHWTFTPYAIYTIPSLMFAITYYNLGRPYSLASLLYPLTGRNLNAKAADIIDAICLYSLVGGMAACLGAGVLTLAGGLKVFFGIDATPLILALVTTLIVGTFIISAITGLTKGIRFLSDINVKMFFILAIFVLLYGPIQFVFSEGLKGVGDYLATFVQKNLSTGGLADDPWSKTWTLFYWANWLAWAPITALFLGRISYGYSVRQFIRMNLVFPALFGMLWMTIFSGISLNLDLAEHGALFALLERDGPGGVVYHIFATTKFSTILSALFGFTAFLSFVAGADSNTEAMSGISTSGISPESPEPPSMIKIVWGTTVGVVAWIMVSFAGIDGIKMLSTLGGLPALFLIILVTLAFIKVLVTQRDFGKNLEHDKILTPSAESIT